MISWIPQRFSEKGKIVDLKNERDEWTYGWKIENVTYPAMAESILVYQSQDHKRTRRTSDVDVSKERKKHSLEKQKTTDKKKK